MSVLSVICCCKLKDVRDETETELTCRKKDVSHDYITDTDHHELEEDWRFIESIYWTDISDLWRNPLPDIAMISQILARYDDLPCFYFAISCTIRETGGYKPGVNFFREWYNNEKICKIHVFCRGGVDSAKRMAASDLREISRDYDVTESGFGWIGIMEKGSSKASAVRFFQQYLNVGDDETAVFGDSSNDVPTLEICG